MNSIETLLDAEVGVILEERERTEWYINELRDALKQQLERNENVEDVLHEEVESWELYAIRWVCSCGQQSDWVGWRWNKEILETARHHRYEYPRCHPTIEKRLRKTIVERQEEPPVIPDTHEVTYRWQDNAEETDIPDLGLEYNKEGLWEGLPVSPGIVEGTVVLVHGDDAPSIDQLPSDVDNVILAHDYPPESWLPILVNCDGFITHQGGMLGHMAVVSREMGVPYVAGIQSLDALAGEEVRLDGENGTVEVI